MTQSASSTTQSIPDYLQTYIAEQHYQDYTPREHATWRYIMRQSREFYKTHAHPIYLSGLKRTGISINSIPRIEEMDHILKEFGWGAVCIRGFIPPLAFLDFQSRHILPIAANMRTLEHIAYTPAPDIVHEAAGHAPILANLEYRQYLSHYAKLARKAIYSQQDIQTYEAIRQLSDMKENPDYSAKDIQEAQTKLDSINKQVTWISESNQISRLYWWTAEYGLVGDYSHPRIYGAGLLSSLEESKAFLNKNVIKKPLTLECINQGYDITRQQPQLYIAKDFSILDHTLCEFEKDMGFRVGGVKGLKKAQESKAVTTSILDSQIGISGKISQWECGTNNELTFIRWEGPVQLSFKEKEIKGHGSARHPHGFSSPLGKWKNMQINPCSISDQALNKQGIKKNHPCRLELESGFCIEGIVKNWKRSSDNKLTILTWFDCTVSRDNKNYFLPEWGDFDMLVGQEIISVYGGPADYQAFGASDMGEASTCPRRTTPYQQKEKKIFEVYKFLRKLREQKYSPAEIKNAIQDMVYNVCNYDDKEWLIGIELVELAHQYLEPNWQKKPWAEHLNKTLFKLDKYTKNEQNLIKRGLELSPITEEKML